PRRRPSASAAIPAGASGSRTSSNRTSGKPPPQFGNLGPNFPALLPGLVARAPPHLPEPGTIHRTDEFALSNGWGKTHRTNESCLVRKRVFLILKDDVAGPGLRSCACRTIEDRPA